MRKILFCVLMFTMLMCGLISAHAPVLAQESASSPREYVLISPLPGEGGATVDTNRPAEYLQTIFRLIIAIVGIFAVLKLAYCGLRYMLSESFTQKASLMECVKSTAFGILLLFSSVIILTLINPKLIEINFEKLRLQQSQSSNSSGFHMYPQSPPFV